MQKKKMTEGMNRRQKAGYVWYYYKWIILLAIGAAVLVSAICVTLVRQMGREYLMNVVMADANSYAANDSDYFNRFLEENGYDDEYEISLDAAVAVDTEGGGQASEAGIQGQAAMFLTGDVDVYISDETLFAMECEKNAFVDLRDILSDEQLAAYSDLLWYGEDPDTGETVPYALDLSGSAVCGEEGFYTGDGTTLVGVGSRYSCEDEDIQRMLEYLIG